MKFLNKHIRYIIKLALKPKMYYPDCNYSSTHTSQIT